jgi:hypothetical protein
LTIVLEEIDSNVIVRFLTASQINYEYFTKKVAPTIDTESCFIIKPIENQKLLNHINKIIQKI